MAGWTPLQLAIRPRLRCSSGLRTWLGEREVAALLRDVPINPVQVADLMRQRGVLVLSDLTLPPEACPLAVAAFRLHRPAGTAELAGIAVRLDLRRRGLGRRLLTGALTWLRAEGFERVRAFAH